jgi:sulfoxide reductase heme-binding subunit YedZ
MDQAIWELIRASGVTAVVLLTVSVAMGISVNVRALDALMKRAWVNEAHGFLSVLSLAMIVFHLVLVVLNRHVPIGLVDSLVPGVAAWRPAALALGTAALYLTAVLVASSYLKPVIGHRAWRLIHYGGFLGWAMAMLHGVMAGTDSDVVWMQWLYLASFGAVLFLTAFRVLAPSRRPVPGPGPLSQSRAGTARTPGALTTR